jgi:cytochrome c oxidase subunit 2
MVKPTRVFKRLMGVAAGAMTALGGFVGTALAAQPEPWKIDMQPAVTEVMGDVRWFNHFTLVIVTVIVLLVTALLGWCVLRFNAKSNPKPSRTSHNTMIEVVWTLAPILILVVISIPSFRLLYKELEVPAYDMTVKATGYQWYWGYEYTDEGMEDVVFDSLLIRDEQERKARAADFKRPESEYPRLLAVDNEMIVPIGKVVRVQVTGADVIHSFAMPAFGVKVDAVPGRLNETWFRADQTGIYYGQCSELCGKDHAYMPIAIRVVEQAQYDKWAEGAKTDVEGATKELMAAIAASNGTAAVETPKALELAAR